jgi:hypothetical protein
VTWLFILLPVGLALIGWLAWWRAGQYQPPPSPAAIELAAMQRPMRIRQMTNLAEDYMEQFVANRQQNLNNRPYGHRDRRWPS